VSLRRLLVPSLSDCLFVSLLWWLFASGTGWIGLLADGDTGWHIRTGQHILDGGGLPRQDLFSFSRPGAQWFAWEWLSDVVLGWLHRQADLKGVVLLAGAAACASITVVFRHALWRGAGLFVALAACLLGAGASTIHYLARPHVFTLVLLAASLWLLDRDRRQPTRAVWLLAPLCAVWVNLHGGFLALWASIGAVAAGTALEAGLKPGPRRWAPVRRYTGLLGVCGLATLLNPYGVQLHVHIAGYMRSSWIREAVHEFQSPQFRTEALLQFEVLLFTGLLLAGSLLARRQFSDALLVVVWAHAALVSVRHIPVYVVVATPIWAGHAGLLWQQWAARRAARSPARILAEVEQDAAPGFRRTSLWAVAALAAMATGVWPMRWPGDFPEEKFPVRLVERHRTELGSARVFTTDQWADYLIYRFHPRHKVFIDGRSDFYGPELGKLYLRLAYAQADWDETARQYGFEWVLAPPDWPLVSLLRRERAWRLVEADARAFLFQRTPSSGVSLSP
jgi:hypothetical protein